MRARRLLIGGLALLLLAGGVALVYAAWSGRGNSHAPPPLNKQLLAGTWKSESDTLFVTGYEFAGDGTFKMMLQGMEQPLEGRYAWSGERTLDLEFPTDPKVQQAYKEAAKAYKDQLDALIKAGKLYDRAGPSLKSTVRDELPAKQTLRVAISERGPLLIISTEDGASQTFEKGD
jgi:hypothetical protein